MVIADPFSQYPKILGSTSPIPMAFLEDLEIDVTGKKLYANYRGAGNIVVINAEALVARGDIEFHRQRRNVHKDELHGQKYAIAMVGTTDRVYGGLDSGGEGKRVAGGG